MMALVGFALLSASLPGAGCSVTSVIFANRRLLEDGRLSSYYHV
jgi:hypothetical protein